MDSTGQLASIIALTMGTAWASGINLYAAVLVLGLMALNGAVHLPEGLQMLVHPWVIGAAGCMYVVEFFADKIPGVDTAWDTLHTFIRIPAGAILAAAAAGQSDPLLTVVAGLAGGTVSAGSHVLKAGTRVVANTSPEPFSNWALSLGEDVFVLGGLWAALHHPWLFFLLFGCFLAIMAWALPRIWRGITHVVHRLDTFRRNASL
jgi:hypothetical protein